MRAVDTNAVVRCLTKDDPVQAGRATRLVEREDVFLPLTVLLEAEWVLRSAYGFPAREVVAALRGFAGLAHVTVQSAATAARALDWVDQRLDFADALHLAAAQQYDGFASFDRALARAARKLGAPPVTAP